MSTPGQCIKRLFPETTCCMPGVMSSSCTWLTHCLMHMYVLWQVTRGRIEKVSSADRSSTSHIMFHSWASARQSLSSSGKFLIWYKILRDIRNIGMFVQDKCKKKL